MVVMAMLQCSEKQFDISLPSARPSELADRYCEVGLSEVIVTTGDVISLPLLAPSKTCQSAFGRYQRSRRTKWRSMPDKGAPTSCIAPPIASDPRSIATNPVLLTNSITSCLASASLPDVKMTVRGFCGEKSCIQAIGMLLIDFTSRALTAISATISLDVRPFNAARDLVTPARLISGF